jgi:hypothetical protein
MHIEDVRFGSQHDTPLKLADFAIGIHQQAFWVLELNNGLSPASVDDARAVACNDACGRALGLDGLSPLVSRSNLECLGGP